MCPADRGDLVGRTPSPASCRHCGLRSPCAWRSTCVSLYPTAFQCEPCIGANMTAFRDFLIRPGIKYTRCAVLALRRPMSDRFPIGLIKMQQRSICRNADYLELSPTPSKRRAVRDGGDAHARRTPPRPPLSRAAGALPEGCWSPEAGSKTQEGRAPQPDVSSERSATASAKTRSAS